MKMTWNILNTKTGRVKDRIGISELIIDNHSIISWKQVSMSLEKHFAHIPLSISKGLISLPEVAELLLKQNAMKCKMHAKMILQSGP